MNRRNFLNLAALAIAGKAAERVFPFRVYSIPKEIVAPPALPADMVHYLDSLRYSMQMLVGTPPAMFGGVSDNPPDTATGVLIRYQNAVARDMSLYGSAAITPEMLRRAQKQIMERLGTKPLEINSYPLL